MTMTAEQWQQRLAGQQAAWEGAEATTGSGSMFVDPPDGTYQGTVFAFDFIDTDTAGAFLKIEVQVANGEQAGKVTGELFALEDKDRLQYTKGALSVIGVDVENTPLSQIHPGSPVLEAVLDTPIEFTVKRSGSNPKRDGAPYVNVYLNKRLGGPLRANDQQQLPASQEHPSDVPGDEAPWTSKDLAEGPNAEGKCICPDYPTVVSNDCTVPGHKIDF